jgi:hypothetical protein
MIILFRSQIDISKSIRSLQFFVNFREHEDIIAFVNLFHIFQNSNMSGGKPNIMGQSMPPSLMGDNPGKL